MFTTKDPVLTSECLNYDLTSQRAQFIGYDQNQMS